MELTESKLEWPCPHCGGDLTKFVDDVTSDAIRYGHARLQELEAALEDIVDTFYNDSRPIGYVARAMLFRARRALLPESTEGEK